MKSKSVEKAVRKHYSAEFKKQALLRAEEDGVSVAARDLGLRRNQLYNWRAQAKSGPSEQERLAQSETARLRREVARLEEENAFLKKAAAYFAKVTPK